MSAVESIRARQEAQLSAVEGLEVRARRRRELQAQLDSEDRDYAREWQDALKLDLTEGALVGAGLPAPVAPARSRRKSSRSVKGVRQQEVPAEE